MTASPVNRYDPPTRVSIVCYLLFSIAGVEAIRVVLLAFFPRPAFEALHMPYLLAGFDLAYAVALSVSAWFMLKGANWARIMFYVLCAVRITELFVSNIAAGFAIRLGVAIFKTVVFGGVLMTRRANEFFAGRDPLRGKPPPTSKRPTGIPRGQEGKYDY
jgi:hypothetical protein